MPNYFILIDKKTSQQSPLQEVDDRICREVYNCEPHPKKWGASVFDWYNTIGFSLAMGKTLEDGSKSVRKYYQETWKESWEEEPELKLMNKVIDFLQENYTVKSGYTVR